jgi:hypothetical protein
VTFVVEHKVPTSGREYGSVWVRQGCILMSKLGFIEGC